MKKKELSSMTLSGSHGDPSQIIVPGHVNAKTFNQAVLQEWSDAGYTQKELSYVYLRRSKRGKSTRFLPSVPGERGAKPYTRSAWDHE